MMMEALYCKCGELADDDGFCSQCIQIIKEINKDLVDEEENS
jgi:hypothetical protein